MGKGAERAAAREAGQESWTGDILKKKSLKIRILEALVEFPDGKARYIAVLWKVWPRDEYPRAHRHSSKGGPPGVAFAFGVALRKMQKENLIMRLPNHIDGDCSQRDILLLSPGRKLLKESK
jgi:hypothetical protein